MAKEKKKNNPLCLRFKFSEKRLFFEQQLFHGRLVTDESQQQPAALPCKYIQIMKGSTFRI